ncbi:hypothetical protein KCP75_04320 [Salmonella enterica subsp. enterica]|nr:hypothetical protein KCP75_04320 [Salmonella enterica subsp. enterica]
MKAVEENFTRPGGGSGGGYYDRSRATGVVQRLLEAELAVLKRQVHRLTVSQ